MTRIEQPCELFGAVLKPGIREPPKLANSSYHVQAGVAINHVRPRIWCESRRTRLHFAKHQTSCPLSAEHFEATGPHNRVALSYLCETMAWSSSNFCPKRSFVSIGVHSKSPTEARETLSTSEVLEARSQALLPGLLMHCDFLHQGGRNRVEIHPTQDELDMVDSRKWQAEIVKCVIY
ncbi:hypothetical protein F5B21DRAFT_497721 [Xylaria acuta]|nr:hypothetical protein F5B21DRAFT_497721 [Xylaria acuta]